MAYSSIKPKKGICLDCGKPAFLTAKRCQYCYKRHRGRISIENQKETNPDDNSQTTKRKEWFMARVAEMNGNCAECGAPINKNIFKYAICAVAHILPKSVFDSVQYHPLNWMELGATCGCHSKSETWSNAVHMKIWPEMVRRFSIFYPFIAKEEQKHIPEILLQAIISNPEVETKGSAKPKLQP